jgi:hypothetical protein
VFYGHLITVFIYGNLIALLLTYPLTRGVVMAVRSKTRMELFLYGNHPDILDESIGDFVKDNIILKHADNGDQKEICH